MANRLHDDEIPIDADLVRRLIDRQFPHYAALPLRRLATEGSSNQLFRLGDELLVRLPRQPGGGTSIEKEHRWLPVIGRQLPVRVPEILALGEAGFGFGERWSIVRWLNDEQPQACFPDDAPTQVRSALAVDLAEVIRTLRSIDVPDAARSDPVLQGYRGRSLSAFDQQMRRNIERCRELADLDLDLEAALRIWEDALGAPGAGQAAPDRWYHGDLVAENLVLTGNRLTAVLDFGGLSIGDPTIDLHGAWELLDEPARRIFRARLEVDDAEWVRGRAWALAIALGTFPYYWTSLPRRARDRLAMARSVLADGCSVASRGERR